MAATSPGDFCSKYARDCSCGALTAGSAAGAAGGADRKVLSPSDCKCLWIGMTYPLRTSAC
eukprot:6481767-Amphidinium_carterae.1